MEKSYILENKFWDILNKNKESLLYPLTITDIKHQFFHLDSKQIIKPDALIKIKWLGKEIEFFSEFINRTRPQFIQSKLERLNGIKNKVNVLLVVPYLSKYIYDTAIEKYLSVIDLNGNYLLQSQGLLAVRTDRENKFKEPSHIKQIFSENSSIVGRLLLSKNFIYESVNEVFNEIKTLSGELSLSSVSKVLKGLEEEMIIDRSNKKIRLIQPDKLLQQLKNNYKAPKQYSKLTLKLPINEFISLAEEEKVKWSLTGESSADYYTITTPSQIKSVYLNDKTPFEKFTENRFYNLVMNVTEEPFVYFDLKKKDKIIYASEIQTYLELSKLDKREQDLAANIEKKIQEKFK